MLAVGQSSPPGPWPIRRPEVYWKRVTAPALTQDQAQLAALISHISQRAYRAGWMLGIEAELWRAIQEGALGRPPLRLTAVESRRLQHLSSRCAGWIVLNDRSEETYISMAEWLDRVRR